MGDRKSSGLQRNSEAENAQKLWENHPRKCVIQEKSRLTSRQSSVDSDTSEQNRDNSMHGKVWTKSKNSNFSISNFRSTCVSLSGNNWKTTGFDWI